MDGSGKTTQMKLLADRLRASGRLVVETQEPGGTAVGRQIREVVLDAGNEKLCPIAEMLLYFAARAQNFDEVIHPAWKHGAIVLADRFTDSTLAYQGRGRGLGNGVVMNLHNLACHGLQPDLTICLDIDVETGLHRAKAKRKRDRIEEQSGEFHSSVREAYLELAREFPDRIRLIDGRGNRAEIAERVWSAVEPSLKSKHRV